MAVLLAGGGFTILTQPRKYPALPPRLVRKSWLGVPHSIAAEPFEPIPRKPDGPLPPDDEVLVRAWARHIGETEEGISEVIDQCNTDADARGSYLEAAEKVVMGKGY